MVDRFIEQQHIAARGYHLRQCQPRPLSIAQLVVAFERFLAGEKKVREEGTHGGIVAEGGTQRF